MKTKLSAVLALFALALVSAGCAATGSAPTAAVMAPPASHVADAASTTGTALALPANCEGTWKSGTIEGTTVINNLRITEDGQVVSTLVADTKFLWKGSWAGREQKMSGYLKSDWLYLKTSTGGRQYRLQVVNPTTLEGESYSFNGSYKATERLTCRRVVTKQ